MDDSLPINQSVADDQSVADGVCHSSTADVVHQPDCPQDWRSPAEFPRLDDGAIHLWRAPLSCDAHQLEAYAQTLSPDERERAARFKFEPLRQRFTVGRGILRRLLGQYLAIAPASIQFTYGSHGKPRLDADIYPTPLRFNLAHSNDRALFAFSRDGALGVDIEHVRSSVDVRALSQRFFTNREHEVIVSLPYSQQGSGFFCFWTCKEAYLKATGEGLAGLQSVEIDILPDGAVHLRVPHESSTARSCSMLQWQLHQCWPDVGYVGAIALGRDPHTQEESTHHGHEPLSRGSSPALIHTFDYAEWCSFLRSRSD